LILSDLNIPYRSYILPWKRQLHSLKNGQLDLILTLYWTNGREKIYDLTIPYTQKDVFIYVKTGKEFVFEKWEDLIGKSAVISLGTSKGEKFDKFMLKNLTVEETVNLTASVKMLKLGRVDYLIGGDSSTYNAIKELGFEGKIKALPKPLVIQNLHMAISKKSQYRKYLSQINKKYKK
jgi:ABC-type amino acid transport substrate-binding protein